MRVSIRTKFVSTLVLVVVAAAVPLSLYIVQHQEQEKIEATILMGKGNTRLLALSMLDVFLKTGGQIDSMRIDAEEAINVFSDQIELGLIFGQTIMINERNYGTVMATLKAEDVIAAKNQNPDPQDAEPVNGTTKNTKLSKEEIETILRYQENFRGSCLSQPDKTCYNFVHIASYQKYPVVLSVMSVSEEHILAPIKKMRRVIYISAAIAVALSIIIGVSASQFLTRPIFALVDAVRRYSQGERDTRVEIHVRDELRTLGDAFNEMAEEIGRQIKEIEDHRDNLELKVQERTSQLQEALQNVQKLKEQQDGDYFLTTFLFKPLCLNANNSSFIKTEFFLKQKKEFEWRGKKNEIGGDICITRNLKFAEGNRVYNYVFATNADAMGKSIQGAGGAIVFGTALNTILTSSAAMGRVLQTHPKVWLTRVYRELHQIFLSFHGSMMVSASFMLINEHNGYCYFINAEHPFAVLYRDETPSFLEEGTLLRKLGSEIPMPEEPPVLEFTLSTGDIVLLGSDGRDDLAISVSESSGERNINEDEQLFLRCVKKANGDLQQIVGELKKHGEITDDLSLLRIELAALNQEVVEVQQSESKDKDIEIQLKEIRNLLREKRYFLAEEKIERLALLEGLSNHKSFHYLAGMTYYSTKNFIKARTHLEIARDLGAKQMNLFQALVKIYEQAQEEKLLKETLSRILDMEPSHEMARKKLGELS